MKRFKILVIDRMMLAHLWKKPMPLTGSRSSYHKSRMNTRRQKNISRVFTMSKMLDNDIPFLSLLFFQYTACLLARSLSFISFELPSNPSTQAPFFISLSLPQISLMLILHHPSSNPNPQSHFLMGYQCHERI